MKVTAVTIVVGVGLAVAGGVYLATRNQFANAAQPPPSGEFAIYLSNGDTYVNGTSFLLEVNGRRVVVAPYHLWSGIGLVPSAQTPATVYRRGYAIAMVPLVASRQHDVVLIEPPPELADIGALSSAPDILPGETVHGTGITWLGLDRFSGVIQGMTAITEANAQGVVVNSMPDAWAVTATPDTNAEDGDSGSPVLNYSGQVVGEEISIDSTSFFFSSIGDIATLAATLPAPGGEPFIQVANVAVNFTDWFNADLSITLKNTGSAPSTTGQYGLCITAHAQGATGPVISRQYAGNVPTLTPGEQTTVDYAYSLPLGTLADHTYWFEVVPLCDGCPQGIGCQNIRQMQVL